MTLPLERSAALETEHDLLVSFAEQAEQQGWKDREDWSELRRELGRIPRSLSPREIENRLDGQADKIRRALLRRGHWFDVEHMRSPDSQSDRLMPNGEPLHHAYERSVPAEALERRLAARVGLADTGWTSTTVATRSAMAALHLVLTSLGHMLQPTPDRPLRIGFAGSYFETTTLLEYLSSPVLQVTWLGDDQSSWSDAGAGAAGAPEVLVLEPVRYDWGLRPIDVQALLRTWSERRRRPRIVVIDTTLSSAAWPTAKVLAALGRGPGAPMVIEVRSGLKLDQQGLEVANLGVIDVFAHDQGAPGTPSPEQLGTTLRLMRGTLGAGLSVSSLAALDAPFLLTEAWTRIHAGQVMANNARVAEILASTKGLFREVVHPSLGVSGTVRHAPFVIGRIEGGDAVADHGLVLAVIREAIRERGLVAVHGSSFGFRHTRFETILPRADSGTGLFKVAAGSRAGPSLEGLIEVLQDIGGMDSMKSLRRRYGALTPVPLR